MSDHHTADSVVGQMLEGEEVDTVDVLLGVIDDRQIEVAVDIGIAVSGEVFCDSNNAKSLHSRGIESRLACHTFFVFAEGAATDDGVERVVVDVADRSEIGVDAHFAALACNFSTEKRDEGVVAARQCAH